MTRLHCSDSFGLCDSCCFRFLPPSPFRSLPNSLFLLRLRCSLLLPLCLLSLSQTPTHKALQLTMQQTKRPCHHHRTNVDAIVAHWSISNRSSHQLGWLHRQRRNREEVPRSRRYHPAQQHRHSQPHLQPIQHKHQHHTDTTQHTSCLYTTSYFQLFPIGVHHNVHTGHLIQLYPDGSRPDQDRHNRRDNTSTPHQPLLQLLSFQHNSLVFFKGQCVDQFLLVQHACQLVSTVSMTASQTTLDITDPHR